MGKKIHSSPLAEERQIGLEEQRKFELLDTLAAKHQGISLPSLVSPNCPSSSSVSEQNRRIIFPSIHDNIHSESRLASEQDECRSEPSCPLEQDDIFSCITERRHRPSRRHSCSGSSPLSVSFASETKVHEYENGNEVTSNKWFGRTEMKTFRREAGVKIKREQTGVLQELSHNAFSSEANAKSDNTSSDLLSVRTILIVASHDMLLLQLSKSMQKVMPNVRIDMTKSSADVLRLIELEKAKYPVADDIPLNGYDVIIIDERLYQLPTCTDSSSQPVPVTGLKLLQHLDTKQNQMGTNKEQRLRYSLLVGMFYNPKKMSVKEVKLSGVDMVWCKRQLPSFDCRFSEMLVSAVDKKRQ